MAAFDAFLKIKGIDGESTDKALPNQIELLSFSWGAMQSGSSSHGTGAGAGKVNFNDFHFTMKMNKASSKLFLACSTGEHIGEAKLTCRKATGEKQDKFLEVTFTDVLVSSYQTGGGSGGEGTPTESISLNFTKVEIEYFSQNDKGVMKSEGKLGWDVKKNAKA